MPFGALLCTHLGVKRSRQSRCQAYHEEVGSPFHRALYLGFRCSTVLPGAAMHGDVEYLLRCHKMGKHRLDGTDELNLALNRLAQLGLSSAVSALLVPCRRKSTRHVSLENVMVLIEGIRKYMQEVKYTCKIRCAI